MHGRQGSLGHAKARTYAHDGSEGLTEEEHASQLGNGVSIVEAERNALWDDSTSLFRGLMARLTRTGS